MVFKKIFARGSEYFTLGKDIVNEGVRVFNERKAERRLALEEKIDRKILKETPLKEESRKKLEKNLSAPLQDNPIEKSRQKSLHSHQAKQQVSGERSNANMLHRNYDNHQGN